MNRICCTLPLLLAAPAPDAADAGGFARSRSHVQRSHYAPHRLVYPQQQIYYFVGQPLRLKALLEAAKRADPQWQEFQRFKQFQQRFSREGALPSRQSAALQTTILAQKCARCHTGTAPKGGLLLDGSQPLESEAKLKVLQAAWSGHMPPERPLSDEETSQLFEELLR